ncbi:MAG: hypothetical protein FJ316_08735 [SAR202 cluster bacterium]|nr:hypothetical protein [SAR202 cluster bacterium]
MKHLMILLACLGLLLVEGCVPAAEARGRQWDGGSIDYSNARVSGAVIDDILDKVNSIQSTVNSMNTRVTGINTSVNGANGLMTRTDGLKDRTIDTLENSEGILTNVEGVPDLIQFVADQQGKLSPEILQMIEDAVVQLQQVAEDELEGAGEFRGNSGDCSSSDCIRFRAGLSDLLTNTESLYNALSESDPDLAASLAIDPSLLRDFVEILPAAALYPMFRATKDSDILNSDFAQLLADLEADVRAERAFIQKRVGLASLTAVSQTSTECLDNLSDPDYAVRTKRLKKGGMIVKQGGKLLIAIGKSKTVEKSAGLDGWVSLNVRVDVPTGIGTIMDGTGDVLMARASSNSGEIALCTTLEAIANVAPGDAQDRCELEVAVAKALCGRRPMPNCWSGRSCLAR